MTGLEAVTLVFQFLAPFVLMWRVAFVRGRTRLSWVLDIALAGSYLVLIALVGLWLALPWYLPWVLGVLLIGAAAAGRPSAVLKGAGPTTAARASLGFRLVLVLVFAVASAVALAGRQPLDDAPVDLAFPLREGTYLVASGGSSLLVNFHLGTLTREQARPYRGQSYAVDLVRVGWGGTRLSGLSPNDPSSFAIFGDSIHAPCTGEVVLAVDGEPDLRVGEQPATLLGNHVVLSCRGTWIVMAHLMRGSVRVLGGQEVAVGQVLGLVGNSGASGEPHLHIHAQTPGTREAPISGDPVPVTFAGRYLIRNDRVRRGSGQEGVSPSPFPSPSRGSVESSSGCGG